MRLKKLILHGFKSFADKTVLTFDEGITGVVGPNGCGKSNIADAFRWVLGEQSAKSMRGAKMPDVIFAGSTNRKPLEYAEVTIVLGDIGGRLPVVFEEIAVTRRLHRSGESDYFLNGHPVRLKDIQSLFLDTGIGKSAFSVFEQGKIDQIIQLSPQERRYIFEEAAGILRFLQRKREAMRKLEQTDQNISRVNDIHQEVEKQILVLEQQAEKARYYKDSKATLESMEKSLLAVKWQTIQQRKEETKQKEEDLFRQIEIHQQAAQTDDDDLQRVKEQLANEEKNLRVRHEESFRKKSEKEVWNRELHLTQERLKEVRVQEKRWMSEIENLLIRRQERKSELHSSSKRQKEVKALLEERKTTLGTLQVKTEEFEQEVARLREEQQHAQQQHLSMVHQENKIDGEIKQSTLKFEHLQDRREQLNEKNELLKQQLTELKRDLEQKQAITNEASHAVDDHKALNTEVDDMLHSLHDQIQHSQTHLDSLKKELTENLARQKVLMKLRDDMEGFSLGSKKLLQESSNPKSPLHNKLKALYELVAPRKGSKKSVEKAVAAAMRPYAQTLVVESAKDFHEVWQYTQKNQVKDFSLLCLENLSGKHQADTPHLLEHVEDHPIAHHFLKEVHLADVSKPIFDWLQSDHRGEVWTEEGIWIDRRRVLFDAHQKENSVFLREAELKNLELHIAELEKGCKAAEHDHQHLLLNRSTYQTRKFELDKLIRKSEMKLVEANFTLQRCQADLQKTLQEEKQVSSEFTTIHSSMETLQIALTHLQKQHVEVKAKAVQVQQSTIHVNAQLDARSVDLKTHRSMLAEAETLYRQSEEEYNKLHHLQHVNEVKDTESVQQEERLTDEIQASREKMGQLKERVEECELKLEQIEEELTAILALVETVEEAIAIKKAGMLAYEGMLRKSEATIKQFETQGHQLNILSTQLISAQQAIEKELTERYHLTLEEALALPLPLDKTIEQAEKQIKALRQDMEQCGDINMTSIEEHGQCRVRYEFLAQQLGDLTSSKEEVFQIVSQLDSESRKIFKETFELIRGNFKKNFHILFNGGEADLQFTETDDILEAGIEISAKPPGKQMRSISLLSGGEKCLTALALLFAIFEVKPAPFCILDEIDAPLDDANVDRFANIVKEFIDRCQFIIITHNKRTMSIADILFGVSMQERGVSKLLALELAAKS